VNKAMLPICTVCSVGARRPIPTATAGPKVFDLVLYNHEHDMVPIRVAELGNMVNAIIFAQTTFTFSSGTPKETPFPKAIAGAPPEAIAKVRRVILNATPAACWTKRFSGDFYPPLKAARSSSKLPWCIQSAVRNMLGVYFTAAGGTDSDWALVSDADEIAHASAVAALRRTDPLANKGVLVLGYRHHFKYTLRCAETGTMTRGPIAISGLLLRELGAQRARDGGKRSCLPVGPSGSCGRVARRTWPDTSWQFSNFGGLASLKFKLRTNSFAAKASMLDDAEVLRRERGCHDHLGRGQAFDYNRTAFDANHLPHVPDVPAYLEHELASGRLAHFVDMGASQAAPLALVGGDDPRVWMRIPTMS